MKWEMAFKILVIIIVFSLPGFSQRKVEVVNDNKSAIVKVIGIEEYKRIISLSLDDFDQSEIGFRQYTDNYDLTCMLIPQYISVNVLSKHAAANLHWHLGQIYAFNDDIDMAISEMKLSSFEESKIYWKCYVEGTIAFLEKDKAKLIESLDLLKKQDYQMNIEFLEKFIKYLDKAYWEAYNAD